MSFFWTALRNGAVAFSAIIVFAWITSQYAAIAHLDAAAERVWHGLPLHQPSAFLHWGFAGARFWGPAFALALLGVLGLGAFGLTVLLGWITPPLKPLALLSTRGFAQRETLGHLGLLEANGLALGAVRCAPWSRWEQISAPPGHSLIIGKAAWANDALLAAAAAWRGALVVADGGSGLSLRLPRRDVVRWAPGRPDAISLNPMLMLRPGPNAWADAQRLAHAFLGESSSASKDAFALLILDQLMTAPIEHRSLVGLRRRLADPGGVYETITARWGEDKALGPHARLARASALWREQRTLTLERLRAIDERLTLYDDCAFAEASSRLQFELADLATGDGPKTLALTLPPQHLGNL